MLYDLSGWVNASDIIWDTPFNVSRTLNSTAGGIDFATRVENNSAYTQTVSMNLSGGKFGASDIQLNPVNGDLVINGSIYNDNSLSYNIWGNTGRTLTLNSTLGPNATQSGVNFTIQRNTTVQVNTNQLWQGGTTLNGGTLRVGASGLLGNGNYSGAIVMNSFSGTNASLAFSNSSSQTLSGAISGSGSLIKAGSGTLMLLQANSYSSGTVVSQGTLIGSASTSFGSGSIVLGDGTTGTNGIVLVANSSGNTTIANAITVANLGSGLVSIGGSNTGSGNYNQWSGLLTLNRNVQLFASDTSTRSTFDGQITGSGGITITQGRVTLGNTNNNFTGSVLVNNGATLQLDVASGINELIPNSSAVTVNGSLNFASGGGTETIGSLSGSGTVSSVVNGNYRLVVGGSDSTTFSGAINNGSGIIGLTQSGSGTLTLTGNNTYTGTTTITNGGTQVLNFASFGSGARNYAISSNSVLALNATSSITAASGSSTINGSGTLIVTNGLLLTTNNSILTIAMGTGGLINVAAGATVRNGGWKNINWTNNQASMMLNGAVDIWDGQDIFIDALNGNGAVTNSDAWRGNINLTLGVANGSGTFTGQFTAPNLSIIKSGTGTQILAGTNTYTGGTTISGGTLQVGNGGRTGTLGSGNVTNNASLAFNRSDNITASNTISGSGQLVQAGAGTTTLTGNNTYTGGTTINAGTLALGAANRLADGGAVTVNAGTFDLGGFSYTLGTVTLSGGAITNGTVTGSSYDVRSGNVAAVLAGNGALTKSGAGAVILSGSNTYTGGTTVSDGTLQVGNGGTNGTMGTGAVVNNSKIALNRADTVTVANLISGTGRLEQSGNGRSILSANNTFSGGTLISAGVLQVGSGASGALGGGNITNNAQLVFDRSDTATVSNRITGNGRVDHSGSGTLVMTGNNDYSGQTVVGVGVLQVGSGGSVGSIGTGDVYINDNGVLRYNRSDLVTVTNRITYGGGFQQAGTGTTVLLGNNDFYGGTTVSVGTLQVGNGGTNGTMGTGAVVNNSMIVVDKAGTFNLANTISGTGSLTVAGSGTTVLSASNSYSGLTKASGGTLEVNGSIAGGLQVDAGATLKGSGSIGGATTISGTHSVGNSPGLQSFGSSLSYQSNSMVHLEFTLNSTTGRGVSFDAINVAGDLSFAPGAGISLTFNSAGSSVNWNDILWNDYIKTSDGWLLYQVGGNLSGLDNVTLSGSLLDSNGLALSSASQDSSFNLYQVGNNVYLNYSIPEPSTYALMGLGALALVIAVRRRRA